MARAYNKKVRAKSFQVSELVWKTILPLETKSNKFGKWSPIMLPLGTLTHFPNPYPGKRVGDGHKILYPFVEW